MKFIATGRHRSEYPDPITFTTGTSLTIGDIYEGDEGWDDWYFCTIANHSGGWVPEQLIERSDKPGHGIAKDDYTAKELDVNEGDELLAIKFLNGWVWSPATLGSRYWLGTEKHSSEHQIRPLFYIRV
ncbi:SH3 domain-containing protein [Serratia fonticola]|uniref:SH3 domain-containing protein n=1 Tax=Serratia fonticola TaxID=47917 RepID=UPI00211C35F7|nr:SH3 domain-containing protein [Serratia fonticola]